MYIELLFDTTMYTLRLVFSISWFVQISYQGGHGHCCSYHDQTNHDSQFQHESPSDLTSLYKAALQGKETLTVYAGGDAPDQLNHIATAFSEKFPGVELKIVVDFSKYHNARIEYQLQTNTLIPDLTHLQTLYDFERWKRMGVLLRYKVLGWEQIYPEFRDSEGFYTAIGVLGFTNYVSTQLLSSPSQWPVEAKDYLRPEFKGKIITTFPNDDDAVLFWFKLIIDKHGWGWLERFVQEQDPVFVRGTQSPYDLVDNGTFPATFTTAGSLKSNLGGKVVIPNNDPFVTWGQRAAIFKSTRNPNAAKLYLSWLLDFNTQKDIWEMWSVRRDVPVPKGFKGIFSYPGQTDPVAFEKWMSKREEVETFRSQLTLFVGEVQGLLPTGFLGSLPNTPLRKGFEEDVHLSQNRIPN